MACLPNSGSGRLGRGGRLRFGGRECLVGFVEEVDDGLVEAVAGFEAVAGADDVADDDVDADAAGRKSTEGVALNWLRPF